MSLSSFNVGLRPNAADARLILFFVLCGSSRRAPTCTEEERGVDFLSWFLASTNVPPGSAGRRRLSAGSGAEDPPLLHSH